MIRQKGGKATLKADRIKAESEPGSGQHIHMRIYVYRSGNGIYTIYIYYRRTLCPGCVSHMSGLRVGDIRVANLARNYEVVCRKKLCITHFSGDRLCIIKSVGDLACA